MRNSKSIDLLTCWPQYERSLEHLLFLIVYLIIIFLNAGELVSYR